MCVDSEEDFHAKPDVGVGLGGQLSLMAFFHCSFFLSLVFDTPVAIPKAQRLGREAEVPYDHYR